ncbi:hypothetical protein V5O48_015206, partial [Marasmius crinis-equi]
MSHTSYFANASEFVIENGNFATIKGNQIINNNQRIYYAREKERTEYDDYNQVKSGNILRTKDFGVYRYLRRWDKRERDGEKEGYRADKVICAAQVMGEKGSTFTAVSYTGPEARE